MDETQAGISMRAVIVLVLGTVGSYILIEAAWFTYAGYAQPADREGGVGMGVVFVIGPVFAAILGVTITLTLGGVVTSKQGRIGIGLAGLLLIALLGSLFGY